MRREVVMLSAVVFALTGCARPCPEPKGTYFESHDDQLRPVASHLVSREATWDGGVDLERKEIHGWWLTSTTWNNCRSHAIYVCAHNSADALQVAGVWAAKRAKSSPDIKVLDRVAVAVQADGECSKGQVASEDWSE
jgi:hypothetical protein